MAERRQPWRRNEDLERLLEEINRLLVPAEAALRVRGAAPRLPVLLIVGPPRSGTTLLLQWLAATGCFAYPSNLLSRFYRVPAVGAKLQLLLTDPRFAFRDELWDLDRGTDVRSELGKTRGALAPNEFWYFWRRFVPNPELRPLAPGEAETVDRDGLREELAAIERVFERPLALKAMILQYDVDLLAHMLPGALFLHVLRDPLYNAQSLIESRESYYGDRSHWYSARPPEYERLAELDPLRQVAGQVLYTRRSLERQLGALDPLRSLRVEYETLCDEPRRVFDDLRTRLAELGHELPAEYRGPQRFEHTNRPRLAEADLQALARACAELAAAAEEP